MMAVYIAIRCPSPVCPHLRERREARVMTEAVAGSAGRTQCGRCKRYYTYTLDKGGSLTIT